MTFLLIALLVLGLALYETGYGSADTLKHALARQITIQSVSCLAFYATSNFFLHEILVSPSLFVNMGFVIMLSFIVTACIPSIKLSTFIGALTGGIIFPLLLVMSGAGGYLTNIGYADAAGAGLIHFLGGAIALMVSIAYAKAKLHRISVLTSPISAATGFMVLWLGWMGYISVISMPVLQLSPERWIMGMLNMMTGTAWGAVAAALLAWYSGRTDALKLCTIGGLAGMISMSADPFNAPIFGSIICGVIGGMSASVIHAALQRHQIPDTANVISIHMIPGAIGVLAVPFFNTAASFNSQIVGLAILMTLATMCSLNICQLRKS